MKGKSLNPVHIRLAQAATGISPADYPIGSLQSRAAMRVLLDQAEAMKEKLSPYDQDALVLYETAPMITASMSPNHFEVEPTSVYQRGKELSELRREEAEDDDRDFQSKWQGWLDELAEAGLTMRQYHDCQLTRFREAWERQLPNLPFPIRVEGDRVYFRQPKGNWQEQTGPIIHHILGTYSAEEIARVGKPCA
jgi:hypothetical protein